MIIVKGIETVKFVDKHGDPCDTQAQLMWASPTEVLVKDLSGKYTREYRQQLRQYFLDNGVKIVRYVRFNSEGVERSMTISL